MTEKNVKHRPCLLLSLGCLFCIALFFSQGCERFAKEQVCFEGTCINVQVARSREDLMRGLQGRESLGKNEGMIFVFPHIGKHSFWMKNTLIPLDMIWIDYGQRIVHIERNVPPCQSDPCPVYTPEHQAIYVLEINANRSKEMGLEKGKRLDFKLKQTF